MNRWKRSCRSLLAGMGFALAAAVVPAEASASPAAPRRPNILLFIADDWGCGHAGILGDPAVKTPNFDRVAREGVLFRQAYCAAPTCTASRASLLTGQPFYRLEEAARDHVIVGRERHGGDYPCRALHTRDFLYIRNYKPELSPAAADAGPARAYLHEHETDPAVEKFSAAYAGLRPAEELYDKRQDPDQMRNVAADPR